MPNRIAMKNRRKTVIVLLILIIGIAGWQAYSYIERTTRPEPAVVYMTSNEMLISKLIKTITFGKYNPQWDCGTALWASNEDGSRKWIVKKYDRHTNESDLMPHMDFLKGSTPSRCIFVKHIFVTNPMSLPDLPCYDFDLRTGEYDLLEGITAQQLLVPITQIIPFQTTYFELVDPGAKFSKIFEWKGVGTGFEPVLTNELTRLNTEGYTLLVTLGCTYGNTIMAMANKKEPSLSTSTNRVSSTHLFFFDASKGTEVSRWIYPSVCNNTSFVPYPIKEFIPASNPKYEIRNIIRGIGPPNKNCEVLLSHYYRIHDLTDPASTIRAGNLFYRFNPVTGALHVIDVPAYSSIFPADSEGSTEPNYVDFACYDPITGITYLTFASKNKQWKTLGLRSDYTWTKPLPFTFSRGFSRIARDGSIWYVEVPDNSNPSSTVKESLKRYDPITGASKTVANADGIVINFTVD